MANCPFVRLAQYVAKVDYETAEHWGYPAGTKLRFYEVTHDAEQEVTIYLFDNGRYQTKAWFLPDGEALDWQNFFSVVTEQERAEELLKWIVEIAATYKDVAKKHNFDLGYFALLITSRLMPAYLSDHIALFPPELLDALRLWASKVKIGSNGEYKEPYFINAEPYQSQFQLTPDEIADRRLNEQIRFEDVVDGLRSHFGLPPLRA